MKQRGRKSVAALAVMPLHDMPPVPLQPPATLSEPAKRVFVELVSDCDPHHFVSSDVGLLCQYCEAQVLAERAAQELQGESPPSARWLAAWREGTRTMKDLSLRLRLSPQSRREKAKAPERPLTWDERFRLEHYGRL